jgi:hypothetical protein
MAGRGFAQSAGVSRTFQGGKGGTKATKAATRDKVLAKGKNSRGQTVTVREAGGDNALVGGNRRAGSASVGLGTVRTGRKPKQPKSLGVSGGGGAKS